MRWRRWGPRLWTRGGFTVVELLVGVALVGLLVVSVGALTRMSSGATAAASARATTVTQRQTLDVRASELARIKPQLGDLSVVLATSLVFRKSMAPTATVCTYANGVLRVAVPAGERATLLAGDSLAVRVSNGTGVTGDDSFVLARIATTGSAGSCDGMETIAVALPSPLPNSSISMGATVRVWSTRRFDVQAAAPTGYTLVESVNGVGSTVLVGPFQNAGVFSYVDAAGAATTTPAEVRLVRAQFVPLQPNQRLVTAVRPEQVEWPIGADVGASAGIDPGDVPVWANPTPAVAPRCTTAGAPNVGSTTAACCAGPWTRTTVSACGYGYNAGAITYEEHLQADCATWGSPTETGNSCTCTLPTANDTSVACATAYGNANWTGSITRRQDRNADCATYGAWYVTSSACSCPLAPSQTQTVSCPWGPSITQTRVANPTTCSWGAWQDSGSCWATPPCPFNPSVQSSDAACPPACQWNPAIQAASSSCRAPTVAVTRQGDCGNPAQSRPGGTTYFSVVVTWNGPAGAVVGYAWQPIGTGFMSGQGTSTAIYAARWSVAGTKTAVVTVTTTYGNLTGSANITYVSGQCAL